MSYKSVILKMLHHSNTIGVITIILAIFVCFSSNNWYYLFILFAASVYLATLTMRYMTYEEKQCKWHIRSLQYDCQIASFNSRLSILSNVIISLFGIGLATIFGVYLLRDGGASAAVAEPLGTPYVVGFLKMLMMYVVSDKVHTSRLIMSILYKYSKTMKHVTIDLDKGSQDLRYPEIFLDDCKISPSRYSVNVVDGVIGVTFNPALSLRIDSCVEYRLIQEDDDHIVQNDEICDMSDRIACLFKCRTSVKRKKD